MSMVEKSIAEAEFARRCNECVLRVGREQELQNQVADLQAQVKRLELQLEDQFTWEPPYA